jgi:predicted XRE-type DNA-binding protein
MVSNAELNDNTLLGMVNGNALRLLRYTERVERAELLLSKKQARRAIVLELHKAGFTKRQIAEALQITPCDVKGILSRKSTFTDAFANALTVVGSFIGMYQNTDDYSQKLILDRERAERLMIVELLKAGLTDIQIISALDVRHERVQRLRKKLQSERL